MQGPVHVNVGHWKRVELPGTRVLGKVVRAYESLGSTNDALAEWASLQSPEDRAPHGAVVIAEAQTAGRGRQGRQWSSPPGLNIYMSVLLCAGEHLRPETFHLTPLAVALGTVTAVRTLMRNDRAMAKWPNDIMVGGRKLGGILLESRGNKPEALRAILGLGLNINAGREDLTEELRDTATSLFIETGERVDRLASVGLILGALESELEALNQPGGETGLIERYKVICESLGQRVRATETATGKTILGKVTDIDRQGALVLSTPDGVQRLMAAEVETIRET